MALTQAVHHLGLQAWASEQALQHGIGANAILEAGEIEVAQPQALLLVQCLQPEVPVLKSRELRVVTAAALKQAAAHQGAIVDVIHRPELAGCDRADPPQALPGAEFQAVAIHAIELWLLAQQGQASCEVRLEQAVVVVEKQQYRCRGFSDAPVACCCQPLVVLVDHPQAQFTQVL